MPLARADLAKLLPRLALGAVILAPLLAFLPYVPGTYFWDDLHLVRDHPLLHAANGWRTVFTTELLEGAGKAKTQFYHPIPLLTLWAQYQLGEGFVGLRVANVLFHVLNVILMVRLLTRVGLRQATTYLASAAFAIQPLAAEPTLLICGRHDTIPVAFALGALLVGLGKRTSQRATANAQAKAHKRSFVHRSLAVFALSLAMCISKEIYVTAVPIAAMAFVISWLLAPPGERATERSGAMMLGWMAFAGLLVAFGIRRSLAISAASAQLFAPIQEHIANYGTIVSEYTQYILLFTNGTTTRAFHPYAFLSGALVLLGAWAIVVGAALLSWRDLRALRSPTPSIDAPPDTAIDRAWPSGVIALFGVLWFLVALGPHIASMPVLGMWGNRYGYYPSIGLWLAVGALAERVLLPTKPALQKLAALACGVPLLIAMLNTMAIAATWHDGVSLFLADVQREPENELANYHLGVEVERVGGCEEALPIFEKAVALKPAYARAMHNVAGCLIRLNRFAEAEAPAARALALTPTDAGAILNLALVQLRLGKLDAAKRTLLPGFQMYPASEPLRSVQREIDQREAMPTAPMTPPTTPP